MLSVRRAVALFCFIVLAPCLFAGALEDGRKAYLSENYKKAMKLLMPLAEEGNAKAQEMVAIMHDYGNGVDKDSTLAMNWYEKSASQGNVSLQHDLGIRYFKGDRVQQDYKVAAKWWKMAAESGVVESQYNLGLMYAQGLGVKKDEVEAVKWYEKAVGQDHANAQYSLGIAYAFGQGVKVDYERAIQFFSMAAKKNVAQAQYNLGVLYENGRGTDVDFEKAKYWYERASTQGLAQAKQKLASVSQVKVDKKESVLDGFKSKPSESPTTQSQVATVPSGNSADLVKQLSKQLQEERKKVSSLSTEVTDNLLEIERLNGMMQDNQQSSAGLDSKINSMAQQLQLSKDEISALQERLQDRENQEKNLNELVKSINKEKSDVELALAANQKESAQLKQEINALKGIAQRSASVEQEQGDLERQYEKVLFEKESLEQELKSVKANVVDMQTLLAANEKMKTELRRVEQLKLQADQQQRNRGELDQQVAQLNQQLAESRQQISDLTLQLNTRRNEEKELRSLVDAINEDKDRVELELATNLRNADQLKSEIDRLKNVAEKSAQMEKEQKELEEQFQQTLADKQSLEREVAGAENNIASLQEMLKARDTGENKLGELVESINKEKEQIQKQLLAKEHESTQLREEITQLKSSVSQSNEMLAEQTNLERKLASTSEEKEQLSSQLEIALATVERLEKTVDNIDNQKSLAAQQSTELNQRYQEAVKLAESQSATLANLRTEKQQLLAELESITQQKEDSETASRQLLVDVNEKSSRIESIAARNQVSETKQKELEQSVAALSKELISAKETIDSLQEQLKVSSVSLPIIQANPTVKVSRYSSFAGKSNWGGERELFTKIHEKRWIKEQEPEYYFLHLITLPSKKFVNKFFDMYPLQEAEKAYFVSRKGSRKVYNIIYGVYQDRSAALRGRDNLPEGIRKKDPMIRDYASIQRYVAGVN